jgi:hypothetical protein
MLPAAGIDRMGGRRTVLAMLFAAVLLPVPGGETIRAQVASWAPIVGANDPVYAVRPPIPGQPDYWQSIRFIDARMKYLDPSSGFFVSSAGEMCFRTFPNHVHVIYDGYYSDWCLYPQAVSSVQAVTMQIGDSNQLVLWCGHSYPQCVRRQGYPFFPALILYSIADSVTVPTAAYLEQRTVLLNLIYLMGGNLMGGNLVPNAPIPLAGGSVPVMTVEEK